MQIKFDALKDIINKYNYPHRMKDFPREISSFASFCVIIPMYNEQKNVHLCVKTICNFLENIKNKCELLVVDDGSQDQTALKLNDLKKSLRYIR